MVFFHLHLSRTEEFSVVCGLWSVVWGLGSGVWVCGMCFFLLSWIGALCRTTPGEWLMDAGQKTDRPPEQIVREVGLTLCLCTYKKVSALTKQYKHLAILPLAKYVAFRPSLTHKGTVSDKR